MVVVIRKAARGEGFDIHAPEGFEEHEEFNVRTLADAQTKAASIADTLSVEIGESVEISDEHESVF